MIIDSIPEVMSLMQEDSVYNITIKLTGTPADNRYPAIRLFVSDCMIWTGTVDVTELNFPSLPVYDPLFRLKIEYYNKTSNDTIVGANGEIISNQSVKIDQLTINDIELSGNQLIEISSTDYQLTDSQQQAYNNNGFPWKSVKTDTLWDNGTWHADIERPIIAGLIKQKHVARQVFELSHLDILSKLQNYFRE